MISFNIQYDIINYPLHKEVKQTKNKKKDGLMLN